MAITGSVLPFRQFVLKVHSRCDLSCDHCYVYEHADQSWRGRPAVISLETVAVAAFRIAEHARSHGLASVRVILHGGEPLLAGPSQLSEIARTLRAAIAPVCLLDLRIQTNGMRLDRELCALFAAEGIKVGISLDGDRAANDLHRRYANGSSSYERAVRAVNLLRAGRFRAIYAGLLCTVDIRADPVATYRALAALDPPAIDFLLPHATWDRLPPRGQERTPYADWLAAVLQVWLADGRPIPVRVFDSIIAITRGGASGTESLGLEPSDVVVIETDGSIEQADSIKVAYDSAPVTGLNVFQHDLDAAAAHPGIRARQQGAEGLCATCRSCSVVTVCGGGLYAHRYRAGGGFTNPSVYCADLKRIIMDVQSALGLAATAVAPPVAAPPRLSAIRLIDADFDALAAGFGDAAQVAQLTRAEQSLSRRFLSLLRERVADGDAAFADGWDLLRTVEREDPAAVTKVLGHPYIRTWAERCLRAATTGRAPSPGDDRQRSDAGHLAEIAVAAAVRSGRQAEIVVPVLGEHLCLPALGRLRTGVAPMVTVTTDANGFTVRASYRSWRVDLTEEDADPEWEPVRELRTGLLAVRLEDTDPYRDCYSRAVEPRLTTRSVGRWQELFPEAWRLIEAYHPRDASGIAAGLSTITPLGNAVPGRQLSVTSRSAFGAIAISLPPDGEALALSIMHEFQHAKLSAVLDLFDLCEATERRLFYAPWRDDPRPVEGLLQGTYAHLGVTDYWRMRQHRATGQAALDAAATFARWRVLTADAIKTLADSGALTTAGGRFVAGMRATVEPWLDEPVPESAVAVSRRWIAERRQAWERLRRQQAAAPSGADSPSPR